MLSVGSRLSPVLVYSLNFVSLVIPFHVSLCPRLIYFFLLSPPGLVVLFSSFLSSPCSLFSLSVPVTHVSMPVHLCAKPMCLSPGVYISYFLFWFDSPSPHVHYVQFCLLCLVVPGLFLPCFLPCFTVSVSSRSLSRHPSYLSSWAPSSKFPLVVFSLV